MSKHEGRYYISAALDNPDKVRVVHGKGDHEKFYAVKPEPGMRNPMICPHNLKGNGTECAIRKWLLKLGVILTGIGVLASFYYMM